MNGGSRPVVLVVEDEPDVAETYDLWLGDDYEVRRAETAADAKTAVGEDVDVVLLDRMLPDGSGEDVLAAIRDRALDCKVAMVSAVDPDFDLVTMGFDDYVVKPPTRDELRGTVADLLERDEYADLVSRYRRLTTKRALLEAEKTEAERAESESFADLEADIATVRERLGHEHPDLEDDVSFLATLRDLTEGDDA